MTVYVPGLTESQTRALVITERVNSSLSVAGILFVIFTYLFSPHFHKPINRLIFFASIGNLGSNIAALISERGPSNGQNSAICQAQAFMVQMFLGVDCLWALCMAINVYLVFFKGYSVKKLKDLDARYLIFCYGFSFIPAFAFFFVKNASRGRIYGPAIIWCWITPEWDFARLIFLYGWIWVAIALATVVYVKACIEIFHKRRYLRGFLNPLNENPFANTVTTEVEITHEVADRRPSAASGGDIETGFGDYSVNTDIIADADNNKNKTHPKPAVLRIPTITREAANDSVNPEAWLYARVAILFFIALLITWVPSSVNRVYAIVKPKDVLYSLNYAASFVFPLQGFWNLIVYLITSKTALKHLWEDLVYTCTGRKPASRRISWPGMSSRPKESGFGWQPRTRIYSAGSSDDDLKLTEAKATFSVRR